MCAKLGCGLTVVSIKRGVQTDRQRKLQLYIVALYYPCGEVGQFFLAENESHIYPNMCAKFGCGLTVVSIKKGGTDRQTKKTAALYSRSPCLHCIALYC